MREPHLPDAVNKAPAWLKPAPFDVDAYFKLPPPGENAAPLYLDALFEFSDLVAPCFPPDQRGRAAAAKQREARLKALYDSWNKDDASVSLQQIQDLLTEFHEGFAKIATAQKRAQCVFATGITYESKLPHGQAILPVVRLLNLKTYLDLGRGDIDQAINNHKIVLQLSRDVRPRGPCIMQVVSIAIEDVISRSMTKRVLNDPGITVAQCDRLLGIWNAHEAAALDPWDTGIKGEYIAMRNSLHIFETGVGLAADEAGNVIQTPSSKRAVAEYMNRLTGAGRVPRDEKWKKEDKEVTVPLYIKMIQDYTPANFQDDHETIEEFAKTLLPLKSATPQARERGTDGFVQRRFLQHRPGTSPFLLNNMVPPLDNFSLACANDALYTRAAKCRIAIRRWQLTHNGANSDLATMCKAAGMTDVPIDPYSGKALKLAVVAGEPVVYSVGKDEQDDKGLKDADLGRKPAGDYLFPLPNLKKRSAL